MDNRQKEIDNLKDYKYGFSTDIENTRAPKGLNEDVIKFISNIKKEPQWMLDFRLKAFERFKQLKEPDWQKPKYPKIDYQDLYCQILQDQLMPLRHIYLLMLVSFYPFKLCVFIHT